MKVDSIDKKINLNDMCALLCLAVMTLSIHVIAVFYMFQWFVADYFQIRSISGLETIGLMIFISYLKSKGYNPTIDKMVKELDYSGLIIEAIITPSCGLLIAYFIHICM